MKMNRMMAVAFGATLLVASSCMNEDSMINEAEISPEVLAAFDNAGFNSADVVKFHQNDPIAGERNGYMLGGDIFISEDQVWDLAPSVDIPNAEQYRTTNLVSSPRTIAVTGLSGYGGGFDLNNQGRTGLQWAINNYNRENLELTFTLNFSSSWTDMVVYAPSGAAGGSAGFPENGDPYTFVQVFDGLMNGSYNTNVVEHVMGHEIGHCLGFRHTDYFNRSISCGSGGNEGTAGVGAIHIPGTPTTNVVASTSIMTACFNSSKDGEFTSSDITALNYLY